MYNMILKCRVKKSATKAKVYLAKSICTRNLFKFEKKNARTIRQMETFSLHIICFLQYVFIVCTTLNRFISFRVFTISFLFFTHTLIVFFPDFCVQIHKKYCVSEHRTCFYYMRYLTSSEYYMVNERVCMHSK